PRHGGDGAGTADGRLPCRRHGAALSGLTVTAEGGSWSVTAGDLPALRAPAAVPPEAAAIVAEAILADPAHAPALARALAEKGAPEAAASAAAVAAAQNALPAPATGAVAFAGTPPADPGLTAWSAPWIPLMLEWELEVVPPAPVGKGADPPAEYAPDAVTARYALLDDAVDLEPRAPLREGSGNVYSGTLVLAAGAEVNLRAQLLAYVAAHPDDPQAGELRRVADGLDLGGMAQTLTGFADALLMRRRAVQLPVADPIVYALRGPIVARFSNTVVPAAVAGENDLSPVSSNAFNPIRAGLARLSRLRVVDAFGQVREVRAPVPAVARSLRPPGETRGARTLSLPPRLAQPARLQFRWLAAAGGAEATSHPATTPVCGWVLYDRLDRSLMLYHAGGEALGSLNVVGPRWQGAPGNDAAFGKSAEEALARADPHLRRFALATRDHPEGAAYLAALLDAIDAAMTSVNPLGHVHDQGPSLLVGRPLALVRAGLRLELEGLPAADQSWEAFKAAVDDPDAPRADGGIGRVRFPVRLGDVAHTDDGLVGYFVDDGTQAAFQRFEAPAAPPAGAHGVVRPDSARTSLAPAGAGDPAPWLTVAMLVDPRGVVHATTGALPVKDVSIPPHHYSRALQRIAVTFLNSPAIGGPGPLALPVPRVSGGEWAWVARAREGRGWDQVPQAPGAAAPSAASWPQRVEEGWLRLGSRPEGDEYA
ncbi:MAG TPA: hypothetical protein VGW10_10345, partial [Solirubrobacteraceae bacterium]|nr:hypothetical protein [Solirubrobacteraceae bacterium]